MKIIDLNENQIVQIEEKLDAYDENYITYKMNIIGTSRNYI